MSQENTSQADTDPSSNLTKLVPDLPFKKLGKCLMRASRAINTCHRALCFYLNEMDERQAYQFFGYTTAAQYAMRELGISRWEARELLAVGRELKNLPEIDKDFRDGRIYWSQVRLLIRVVVPQTEKTWARRARLLNCDHLKWEVDCVQRGQLPRKDSQTGLPKVRFTVRASLDAVAHEFWERAKLKLQDETGESVSNAELMRALAIMLLRSEPESPPKGRKKVDHSLYQVVIQKQAGGLAVLTEAGPVALEGGLAALEGGPAGQEEELVPVEERPMDLAQSPTVLEQEPMVLEEVPSDPEPRPAIAEEEGQEEKKDFLRGGDQSSEPTSPALRRAIQARDGGRCRCCGKLGMGKVHHKMFRSLGGPTRPANLFLLCDLCHALVHEGFLAVSGSVSDGLKFRRTGKLLGQGGIGVPNSTPDSGGSRGGNGTPP